MSGIPTRELPFLTGNLGESTDTIAILELTIAVQELTRSLNDLRLILPLTYNGRIKVSTQDAAASQAAAQEAATASEDAGEGAEGMNIPAETLKAAKLASQKAEIACKNEMLTRSRVERMECVFERVYTMTIYDRLKWLFVGFPAVLAQKAKEEQKVETTGLAHDSETEQEDAENVH